MPVLSKENYIIQASLNGVPLGFFDTFTGGDSDSSDQDYKPAEGEAEGLGGGKKRENVAVTRGHDPERDDLNGWDAFAGKPTIPFIVSWQGKDADGNPKGKTHFFHGHLKGVSQPTPEPGGEPNEPGASMFTLTQKTKVKTTVSA